MRATGLRAVLRPVALLVALAAHAQPLPEACASPMPPVLRERVLSELNRVRAQARECGSQGRFAAVPALVWNERLEQAADLQARWLAQGTELSHAGPQGETPGGRARAAGYVFGRISENLAHGHLELDALFADWSASERHCINLMDPGVRETALACRPAADGRPLWVMVYARPR